MDLSTDLGNAILDHLRGGTTWTAPSGLWLSAHTSDPMASGNLAASEVGTPGSNYNRQQITFGTAASAKSISNTGSAVTITMPNNLTPNTNVMFLGIWKSSTSTSAADFLFRVPLLGTNYEATVGTDDVFNVGVSGQISNGDVLTLFEAGPSTSLPTGLSANTIYYAANVSGATFKVSTSSSGTPVVDVTAAGGCIVRKLTSQPFNAGNQLQVAVGALTISL